MLQKDYKPSTDQSRKGKDGINTAEERKSWICLSNKSWCYKRIRRERRTEEKKERRKE